MGIKLKLIVAASENMGIGKDGNLPWRLKNEMAFFTKMTSATKDKNRKNIVLMGRRTWECIPPKFKPLVNRINVVLSKSNLNVDRYKDTYAFNSLEEAFNKFRDSSFQSLFEDIWVIGGSVLYKETVNSPYFHRLYLTKVHKYFDCDTFLPALPENLKEVKVSEVPQGMQEENDIEYSYHVYERC